MPQATHHIALNGDGNPQRTRAALGKPAGPPHEFTDPQHKELTMTWLAENWFGVRFGVAFIAMHLFGHSGHGGHGGHESHGGHIGDDEPAKKAPDEPGAAKRPGPTGAHDHHHGSARSRSDLGQPPTAVSEAGRVEFFMVWSPWNTWN
jgi:hypothetical protein